MVTSPVHSAAQEPAKHRRISDTILSEIESGRWRPGDRLPAEDRLAERMGASLGTMRRALRSLVETGVLARRQGQGTFVSGARAREDQLRHFRFMGDGGATPLPVDFRILGVDRSDEAGPWSQFLGASEGGYVHIRRLVSVNGEFDLLSEIYLPADRFGALIETPPARLDGVSFRDLIAERFNAPTLKTRQTVCCQVLPPRACRALGLAAGAYGLVWTIDGMSYRDAPVTWQRVFVPPGDRAIEIVPAAPGPETERRP